MAMDFPARHDRSSLNCKPGMLLRDSCTSMISVAAGAATLAGMTMPPRAMRRFFVLAQFWSCSYGSVLGA